LYWIIRTYTFSINANNRLTRTAAWNWSPSFGNRSLSELFLYLIFPAIFSLIFSIFPTYFSIFFLGDLNAYLLFSFLTRTLDAIGAVSPFLQWSSTAFLLGYRPVIADPNQSQCRTYSSWFRHFPPIDDLILITDVNQLYNKSKLINKQPSNLKLLLFALFKIIYPNLSIAISLPIKLF